MALLTSRIVHIHPTRLCNLKCQHCYSTSGPTEKRSLPAELILRGTEKLRSYGYDIASLSGGEPTVYPYIAELCDGLIAQNYTVSIITNGWDGKRILDLALKGRAHTISVSFDGLEELHDLIRARKGSYRRAMDTLRTLADHDIKSGVVISATQASLPLIPDIVEEVIEAGAKRVQLHPISATGRAVQGGDKFNELGELDLVRVVLIAEALARAFPDIHVGCDAILRRDICERDDIRAGDIVSPLVITENGTLLPIAYGISEELAFGTLQSRFRPPVYDDRLAGLVKRTKTQSFSQKATEFYSELVRNSFEFQPAA